MRAVASTLLRSFFWFCWFRATSCNRLCQHLQGLDIKNEKLEVVRTLTVPPGWDASKNGVSAAAVGVGRVAACLVAGGLTFQVELRSALRLILSFTA
jgi:hypothetical protein